MYCESRRMNNNGRQKNEGFTLLEIMIALAIIGMALTMLIHTVNYHAGIMYDNTLTTQMVQIAKEKMNELESAPQNQKGDIGTTGLTFENIVSPIQDSDIVKLTTVVKGQGRQIVFNKLIIGTGNYLE